ncbi:MAG: hypothetical protein WAV11_00260 [Minisyncoccia bacterium]
MDNNFQTSFIPKKPMTVEKSTTGSGINIFLVISVFIFIISIISSAGVYFWHTSLTEGLAGKVAALRKLQEEPTTLSNIIAFDKQLNLTEKILNKHVAVSPILDYLGQNTAQDVRFKSLTFSYKDPTVTNIKMSGVARDFNTIAGQSDAFKRAGGFSNLIFSDFVPTLTGAVSFSLSADLDQSLTNYKTIKEAVSENQNPIMEQGAAPVEQVDNF